jgi:ribonuclease HI
VTRAAIIIQNYLSHPARSLCSPAHSSPTRWIPPQVGTWKVNFDGAMFQASLTSGVGVVVRDHRGYALAALSQKFPIAHALVVIEAMAARAAIQLALDLKLDRVSFEGDSTQVITALQCQDNNYTSYGHLIAETQNKTLSLQSFTFEHVGRSANSVAHVLAKKSISIESSYLWLSSMPHDVISILQADLAH